jgi:hypothetical protein
MSNAKSNRGPLSSWQEVDRGLSALACALDAPQSPREAHFNAALDEMARGPFPEIPTEAEALTTLDEA